MRAGRLKQSDLVDRSAGRDQRAPAIVTKDKSNEWELGKQRFDSRTILRFFHNNGAEVTIPAIYLRATAERNATSSNTASEHKEQQQQRG